MTRQATNTLLEWANKATKENQGLMAQAVSQAKRQGEQIDLKLVKGLIRDVMNKNIFIAN